MGDLIVRGNARTRDKVIRREAVMAGLLPGEVLDKYRLETFQKRLAGTGYFQMNPELGKPIEIKIVNERPGDRPYNIDMVPLINELSGVRMQGDDASGGSGSESGLGPSPRPLPSGKRRNR